MDSSDEELFLFSTLFEEEKAKKTKQRQRRKHKYWVHDINKRRRVYGEFHHLFPQLKKCLVKFFAYFRMSYEKFEELLSLLYEDLLKQSTRFRRPVEPEERLAVCLRFLATGNSFRSLAFNFRLGEKTVRSIVYETCTAVWEKMKMPIPSEEEWVHVIKKFWEKWNFPNCMGALDGKHVFIESPAHSGSKYFCYKKTFSIVLLALVDAKYKFLIVDVGGLGKNSDGSIFANSNFGKALAANKLNLPNDKPFPGTEEDAIPQVIVADAAFPLGRHLMRPYPGNQVATDEEKKIFNYRLSRARRVSENAFGILTRRFRIYERRLSMTPEHVNIIVTASCCLHNFLINSATDLLQNESEPDTVMQRLQILPRMGGNATTIAIEIREKFKRYFMTDVGSLPWQWNVIRRGLHRVN